MAQPLSRYAGGRDNNFNLIRFIAAALVLVSHSFPLTGDPNEPLERFAGFSLGHLGVDVFFAISGYLVTGSLLSKRDLRGFLRARSRRIFPALAANALLVATVVGALHTTLRPAEYFTRLGTWRYALLNATTWPWGVEYALPGVFENVPVRGVVNGSLWSLPWELSLYAMLAVFGALALRARPWVDRARLPAVFLAIAIAATLAHAANQALELTTSFAVSQGVRLLALFASGAAYFEYRDRVPLSARWFVASLLLFFASLALGGWAQAFYVLSLPYAILWLAYRPAGPVRAWNRLGDYSYGLYLWAFPIQQCVAARVPGVSQSAMVGIALPAALAFAVASWHWLESPFLGRKG